MADGLTSKKEAPNEILTKLQESRLTVGLPILSVVLSECGLSLQATNLSLDKDMLDSYGSELVSTSTVPTSKVEWVQEDGPWILIMTFQEEDKDKDKEHSGEPLIENRGFGPLFLASLSAGYRDGKLRLGFPKPDPALESRRVPSYKHGMSLVEASSLDKKNMEVVKVEHPCAKVRMDPGGVSTWTHPRGQLYS